MVCNVFMIPLCDLYSYGCTCTWLSMNTFYSTCAHVYVRVHMYTCICTCAHVYVRVHMYMYMYMYMYAKYVCVHMYLMYMYVLCTGSNARAYEVVTHTRKKTL